MDSTDTVFVTEMTAPSTSKGRYNGVDKHYLFGYMSMADDDDAPDGAWWAMLQNAAAECMKVENDDDRAFEAVHDYIKYCASDEGKRILGL